MKIEKWDMGTLAEIKEKMIIAKEIGDMANFKKYYDLFVVGYKELTGIDFEKKMQEIAKQKQEDKMI